MCTNYTPATPTQLMSLGDWSAGVLPEGHWPEETYPGYPAPIVVKGVASGSRAGSLGDIQLARFGLIPRWCRDAPHAVKVGRGTYNARTETLTDKPSFRGPWLERRVALVPMQHYFEPCWETGRSVRWRIAQAHGELLLAAALHEHWTDPVTRERIQSFSLLTRNADEHPLLKRMHRPGDEKRQLCCVPQGEARGWLEACVDDSLDWLLQRNAPALTGVPAPLRENPQEVLPF